MNDEHLEVKIAYVTEEGEQDYEYATLPPDVVIGDMEVILNALAFSYGNNSVLGPPIVGRGLIWVEVILLGLVIRLLRKLYKRG